MPAARADPTELRSLLAHLLSTQSDLHSCGPAVLHQLSLISSLLLPTSKTNHDNDRARAHALSLALLRLADEKILAHHFSEVPLYWRRLYTDATLLVVFSLLLGADPAVGSASAEGKQEGEEAQWLEAIRLLDMALIVANSPGLDRTSTLFTLLSYCQSHLPSSSAPSSPPPLKRPRLSPPSSTRLPTPHVSNPLPRYSPSSAPSPFLPLPRTPFIITGGCLDWPATELGRWDDKEYLLRKAGGGRVVPVEVGGSYTSEGWGQRVVRLETFLSSLFADEEQRSALAGEEGEEKEKGQGKKQGEGRTKEHGAPKTKKETLYLAQHSLFTQLPSLLSDVLLPDYIYSSPPSPSDSAPNSQRGEEYQPPITEDGYIINAWLGPEGTVSPPHTDRWWNCFAQIVGTKWLWVAPPECGPWMEVYGPPGAASREEEGDGAGGEGEGQGGAATKGGAEAEERAGEGAAEGEDEEEEGGSTNHLLTNTSRLPVHLHRPSTSSQANTPSTNTSLAGSSLHPTEPNTNAEPSPLSKFPSFATKVEPYAMQAVLERGDLLVMPAGWWHSMVSLERSFSVSTWF